MLVRLSTILLASWPTLRPDAAQTRVEFKEPHPTGYWLSEPDRPASVALSSTSPGTNTVTVAIIEGTTNQVEIVSRLVLQLAPGRDVAAYLADNGLALSRVVAPNIWILQASSSEAAVSAAAALARSDGVEACYPVMHRPWVRHTDHTELSPKPNDPLFPDQWHLENRDDAFNQLGPDLNVRAAWSSTLGDNVLVAVSDDGFQLDHPELRSRVESSLHYNFYRQRASGGPASSTANHATCVAGLIAAEAGNGVGVCGVAPRARLTSWVIFGTSFRGGESFINDEQLMDMFQYASNRVSVQNHSWGSTSTTPLGMDVLANIGVENAVTRGRQGKGVVLVRAGGNEREDLINANDDGFANDPRAIAVAAVRKDGRATSYSSPGACLLVAAPSGDVQDTNGDGQADSSDPTAPDVLTTDRTGTAGYNTTAGQQGNYAFFNGTSASSPQVAGVAALILSTKPEATYRDVQQILLLSARHFDRSDPGLRRNGAGLWVSHNDGYGVPDAGAAVRLARSWSNRPPARTVAITNTTEQTIPDDALRVICSGPGLPPALASIHCLPSLGPHPDEPTADVSLADVGQAMEELTVDLHGKAALIQRGQSSFEDKILRAARAGAVFAIVFNDQGANQIQAMGGTTFVPIPAVSIGQTDGLALRDFVSAHPEATARIQLTPAVYRIPVTESLLCEHVGLRLKTTHSRRGDVRITLVSPMGTRSILQAINKDTAPGPTDWTYWSTQHFYEGGAGEWRLEVSDERNTSIRSFPTGTAAATGTVTYAELILHGTTITDTDRDGLDDAWEMQWFGNLKQGPGDDPDADGESNAREQLLGTAPTSSTNPPPPGTPTLSIAFANGSLDIRVSGKLGKSYLLQQSSDLLSWTDIEPVALNDQATAEVAVRPESTEFRFYRLVTQE